MEYVRFMRLWDIYNKLLTPTQQEITDLYFNLDLTVSEIAQEKGISRQAVSECLKTCKSQLEEYESKLKISQALTEISLSNSFMATDISKWAEKFRSAHPALSDEINGLVSILNKDYSQEVTAAIQNPQNNKLLNKDFSKRIEEDNN